MLKTFSNMLDGTNCNCRNMFYISTAVYMLQVTVCVLPQESPDGLRGPKPVVS